MCSSPIIVNPQTPTSKPPNAHKRRMLQGIPSTLNGTDSHRQPTPLQAPSQMPSTQFANVAFEQTDYPRPNKSTTLDYEDTPPTPDYDNLSPPTPGDAFSPPPPKLGKRGDNQGPPQNCC
ncbi:hypothetical protein GOP47_0016553 [Adiantum capillus-veneris]|uniref:Uncharacterized protein n=1 Tax=Adiantum capillus-veneris TaxID=13818 RepID=A0A9D4UIS9_ADICA|nr:hypothetical protein GOP47_0016553 [Adiantum capillus-veneris]